MDIFFGFNHPVYQEIEYRDLRQKTIMPAEVLKRYNKSLTFTISEKEGKHQAGDFMLEEGVYVTIVHRAFCLFLYLTGVHFRGELQHGGDVSQQKIKCRSIKAREIGCVSLSDVLYEKEKFDAKNC